MDEIYDYLGSTGSLWHDRVQGDDRVQNGPIVPADFEKLLLRDLTGAVRVELLKVFLHRLQCSCSADSHKMRPTRA